MISRVRIKLKAFDHKLLDRATIRIVDSAKRAGAKISGPIPLPTKIKKYTVLRSPHVNKKSREQFEVRVHSRIVELVEPSRHVIDAISEVELPSGVKIEVKQVGV